MKEMLIVFLGGGIGAAGRYWLSGLVHRAAATGFPVVEELFSATGFGGMVTIEDAEIIQYTAGA